MTVNQEIAPQSPLVLGELHLYIPPEGLIRELGELAAPAAQLERARLNARARDMHAEALATSVAEERATMIPSSVVCPAVVGHETVATFALARRRAQRELVKHPCDNNYHLIVPRK